MPQVGCNGGSFYVREYSATSVTQVTLPTGVVAVAGGMRPLPAWASYRGTTFVSGYFDRPLMFTPNWGLVPVGVRSPMSAPTWALGSGSGGSSGVALGAITFAQKEQGVLIQESNPVLIDGSLDATGQGYVWSSLPTTSVDAHATHICGYRSMDGALYRLAWERELAAGVTTVTENVLTSLLGRELPTRIGLDGSQETDLNANGVVPYVRIQAPYHDSMYYSGDPSHPERIYVSSIFKPWAVNTSEDDGTFLVTRGGEAVVGMIEHPATDTLLVFCAPGSTPNPAVYAISGYGPSDREMVKINGFYELLSHHSLRLIGPDADVWGAFQEGVGLYNGTFRMLMDDRAEDWQDKVKADPTLFSRCSAVEDREHHAYKLRVPQADGTTFCFFGQYDEVRRGGQPYWTTDVRTREDTAECEIRPYGKPFGEIHTGSADGYIRKENVDSDGTDDGDSYDKALDVTFAHLALGDSWQAGGNDKGRSVTDLDVYTKNETDEGTVSGYAGDDSAREAVSPDWSAAIPAGAEPSDSRQKVPLTSRHYGGITGLGGKGVSIRMRFANPVGVEIRGLSLYHHEGHQSRGYSENA